MNAIMNAADTAATTADPLPVEDQPELCPRWRGIVARGPGAWGRGVRQQAGSQRDNATGEALNVWGDAFEGDADTDLHDALCEVDPTLAAEDSELAEAIKRGDQERAELALWRINDQIADRGGAAHVRSLLDAEVKAIPIRREANRLAAQKSFEEWRAEQRALGKKSIWYPHWPGR